MSESTEVRAELVRLARALGVEPEALDYLAPAGSSALRALRPLVLDRLYAGEDALLHRIAAAGRLVPIAINAHITPRAVPPMLAAALVSALEPDRAVKIASRLPADYLAEAAKVMDPRRIGRLIPVLPLELMITVTERLIAEHEFVTMGSLVTTLDDRSIRALLPVVRDVDLLHLSFHLERKDELDRLATLIEDRLDGIITAAHEHGLWDEALDVVSHFGPANLARIAGLARRHGDAFVADLRAALETALAADPEPALTDLRAGLD
ncbi:MAG: hypothetical protein ACTHMS_13830 [Jatrophihabitans sp.]|uniref:hypothetical protein n=1 Tax=Jatrophihabitans sp. TaxID=1932789 RepID=UPI003F7E88D1